MRSTRATATRLRFAVVVAASLLGATPAHSGSIGFRTDAEVTAGSGVDLRVTLTHTGDEQAHDVVVLAELLDRRLEGRRIDAVNPGQSEVWNFHLFDEIPQGVYVVVLRTRYADSNGYPFETVSAATANVRVQPAPRIFGNVDVPPLGTGGEAVAKLTAKRPSQRSGDYEVRLVAPAGLEVKPQLARLVFDAGGRANVDFRVRNLKLLQGTTVNVFALVDGTADGHPQTDTIRAAVRITASTPAITSPMFYQSATATFLLLVVLEIFAWRNARRSEHRA